MFFGDFVNILKRHFGKSISNEELCGILFDSVILPMGLTNKNGDAYYIDKRTISKVMNGRQNVPVQIRDNINEPVVLSGLVKYFADNIVSELIPNQDDLCFQMMEYLRADRMISPQHLTQFQMLATPSSVAPFLAQVFAHVVMADIHADGSTASDSAPSQTIEDKQPRSNLVLRGIQEGRISESAVTERLIPRSGLGFSSYRERILSGFEKAMGAYLVASRPSLSFSPYSPVKINEGEQKLLTDLAVRLKLELPRDFFDLGDLEQDPAHWVTLGKAMLHGADEAKEKYRSINGILDTFSEMCKVAPFLDSFESATCVALALENAGSSFDEDVRVRVNLPKECALSFDDMLQFDKKALEYMACDCDFGRVFGIERGVDFLAYDSSRRSNRLLAGFPLRFPDPFGNNETDYHDVIPGLFDYEIVDNGSHWLIDLEFDQITQRTAVAFPEIVLLKGPLSKIEYSIRSKHAADAYSGSIHVDNCPGPEDPSNQPNVT